MGWLQHKLRKYFKSFQKYFVLCKLKNVTCDNKLYTQSGDKTTRVSHGTVANSKQLFLQTTDKFTSPSRVWNLHFLPQEAKKFNLRLSLSSFYFKIKGNWHYFVAITTLGDTSTPDPARPCIWRHNAINYASGAMPSNPWYL